jgi:hypothetical protein
MKYYLNIKTILNAIIEKKLPPTFAARTLFIYNSTIIVGLGTITDVKFNDNYTYKNEYSKNKVDAQFIKNLLKYLSKLSFELLNRDIHSKNIELRIKELNNELEQKQNYKDFLLCNVNLLSLIYDDVSYYYNLRNKDGWKESNKIISLANEAIINVNKPINVNDLQQPEQWCPLKNQRMLGSKWGNVKPVFEYNDISNKLLNEFKKIDIKTEAKTVLDVSLNLTPEEKAIAEFWAGIGGSVTPPGFFNLFLCGYFANNSKDNLTQLNYFYKLNSGLFEASIVCWNVKYECLQCRPIQSIRINYPNIPIDYYFGKSNTNLWIPYQEKRLYTPPFPDFISGHSTFSSSAAIILKNLLGNDLHKLNIILTKEEFMMLSPIFKNMEKSKMKITEIVVPEKSSQIIPNTPKKPIILNFNTWTDMAKSAGISRIYGGIHYPSSNKLALQTGKCIGKNIIKLI